MHCPVRTSHNLAERSSDPEKQEDIHVFPTSSDYDGFRLAGSNWDWFKRPMVNENNWKCDKSTQHSKQQHTCAEEAILIVEGVHSSAMANERGGLEGLLVLKLHHTQFSLQVDPLPVWCILNGLIDPPAQLPTHSLPHLCARVYHLQREGSLLGCFNAHMGLTTTVM